MDARTSRIGRLKSAVRHHYKQLEKLRERREQYLRAAAGSLYPHSESNGQDYDILNMMRLAAEAQTLSLAANRPKIIAVANSQERSAFARHYQNAINAYAKAMHLEEVLQECARNAFYSMGICKVHMADSVAVELETDEWMDPGQPFAQSISPHHFSYDTDATHFRHCSFLADRYRVRIEDIVEDTKFPKRVRDEISKRGPQGFRDDDEEWGDTLNGTGDIDKFDPTIFLCDVFLPKDSMVMTFQCDSQFDIMGPPLRELDWDGTETGPYRFLNLGPVPDKTTPSSPAQNLLLQHNLVNSLYRKLEDQAVRQKIINIGPVGDEDDARKVRDAKDGEYISLNDPNAIQQLRMDGPDQPVFGFTLNALEQFSKQAGNLEHRLGMGASADTASQEGMIGAQVSRMEAFYQGRFVTFVREIVTELGRLLFNDQTTQIPQTYQIEGTDFVVDDAWKGAIEEGSRMGEFYDYDLDIEPYSMQYKSPEQRMAEMDAQVQMVVPILPLLMQQGKMLDLDWYFKKRSEYSDMPELERLIIDIPQPPEEQQQGGSHERTMPAGAGGGEYVHRSVGSGGGGGGGQDPMQLMAAGNNGQGG